MKSRPPEAPLPKTATVVLAYGLAFAAAEVIVLLAGHGAQMPSASRFLAAAVTAAADVAAVTLIALLVHAKLYVAALIVKPITRLRPALVETFSVAPLLAANAALWARNHVFVGYAATHPAKLAAYAAAAAAGVALAFLVARLRRRFVKRPALIALGAAAAVAAAVLFVWPTVRAARRAVAAGPDVIFVSLDTVRADHLGCYGYGKDTSPRLDEFAREAVVFENACCAQPTTNPSHASMFTGLYPGVHGVDSNFRPFARKTPLLAQTLADYGYDAEAVIGGFPLDRRLANLSGGFGVYDDYINSWSNLRHTTIYRVAAAVDKQLFGDLRDGRDVTAVAVRLLEKKRRRPLFLFVHYFDPHSPYEYRGDAERFYDRAANVDFRRDWRRLNRDWHHYKDGTPRPAYADAVEALYDDEVRYADAAVGGLLDWLKRSGRWERTMVIVASDHGESFGEHGVKYHGGSLYDAETRVALVIKPAGPPAPRRERRQVETLAIPYTVLAAAGAPTTAFDGAAIDLLKLPGDYAGVAYARTNAKAAANAALARDYARRTAESKTIVNLDTNVYTTFDLVKDAAEVAGAAGADAASRRALAEHIKENSGAGSSGKVGEDVSRVLKSLGYTQ